MVAKILGYHFELWYASLVCNFICALIQHMQQCHYPGHEQFKFSRGRLTQYFSFALLFRQTHSYCLPILSIKLVISQGKHKK